MQSPSTVLRGGTIVDGTGAPPFSGDVVISGDRIVFAGKAQEARSAYPVNSQTQLIDCVGSIVAPGFIDAHSHSDLQVIQNRTEKLLQGVTTEVVGNCGFSAYPVPENPQIFRDFANGILCGDDALGLALRLGVSRVRAQVENRERRFPCRPWILANQSRRQYQQSTYDQRAGDDVRPA